MKKNDFYQVFDSQFNKDVMYHKISDKLKKQKRKQVIMKYSFASIILIFAISGFLISKNMFNQKEVPKVFDDVKDEIYINEIDYTMYDGVSNLDVQIISSNQSSHSVQLVKASIPEDLVLDHVYYVFTKDSQTGRYDLLHDVVQVYSGKNRAVNVSYSSVGEVLRDMDIPDGNLSIIEGVEVMISKSDQTLIGQFKYQNVYYDIESFGLTIDEFLNIIKSIIEQERI